MFSAFSGVSSIASHTLANRFLVTCLAPCKFTVTFGGQIKIRLAGFLGGLPETQDINRIGKLRDITRNAPAASRILISCTPAPMPLYNILYILANPFDHLVEAAFSIYDWWHLAP